MIDTAIILAAGRGSRLKEVTATRSKALAPVAGKPMIGRVIEPLHAAGIRKLIVVRAPHDQELAAFCADIPDTIVVVQEKPLGSADALRSCADRVPTSFLVCACDSLMPADDICRVMAAHSAGTAATLSIIEVSPDTPLTARSVVTLHNNRVTDLIEKPRPDQRPSNFSCLPLYALNSDIFGYIDRLQASPRGELELPQAFRAMISEGRVVNGIKASERFDLTDQSDLLSLNERFLASQSPPIQIHPSVSIPPNVQLIPPVLIEASVVLGDGAKLGPSVYIEQGAIIAADTAAEHAVVLRNSQVSGVVQRRVVSSLQPNP